MNLVESELPNPCCSVIGLRLDSAWDKAAEAAHVIRAC
jgi:hypothetical protein